VLGASARHTILDVLAAAIGEQNRSPKSRLFALKWLDMLATQHAASTTLPGRNPAAAASKVLLFSRSYTGHTSTQNYVQTNISAPLSLPFVNTFFASYVGDKSLPILHGLLSAGNY
jgi:hypothetical protein